MVLHALVVGLDAGLVGFLFGGSHGIGEITINICLACLCRKRAGEADRASADATHEIRIFMKPSSIGS